MSLPADSKVRRCPRGALSAQLPSTTLALPPTALDRLAEGAATARLRYLEGDFDGAAECAPLGGTYFNMRKTTIYGGSNEVQRNIVSQTLLGA